MQTLTPVRFLRVPLECVHGSAWAGACTHCEFLATQLATNGPGVIPRHLMAVATVVTSTPLELTTSQPKRLPSSNP